MGTGDWNDSLPDHRLNSSQDLFAKLKANRGFLKARNDRVLAVKIKK